MIKRRDLAILFSKHRQEVFAGTSDEETDVQRD